MYVLVPEGKGGGTTNVHGHQACPAMLLYASIAGPFCRQDTLKWHGPPGMHDARGT